MYKNFVVSLLYLFQVFCGSFVGFFSFLGLNSLLGNMDNLSIKFETFGRPFITSENNVFLNSLFFFSFCIPFILVFYLFAFIEARVKQELK